MFFNPTKRYQITTQTHCTNKCETGAIYASAQVEATDAEHVTISYQTLNNKRKIVTFVDRVKTCDILSARMLY